MSISKKPDKAFCTEWPGRADAAAEWHELSAERSELSPEPEDHETTGRIRFPAGGDASCVAEKASCAALTHKSMRRMQVPLRSDALPAGRDHPCVRLDHSCVPRIQVAVRMDESPVEANRLAVRLNPALERRDTSPLRPGCCGLTTNQVAVRGKVFAAANTVSLNADAMKIQAEFSGRATLNHPAGAADCALCRRYDGFGRGHDRSKSPAVAYHAMTALSATTRL